MPTGATGTGNGGGEGQRPAGGLSADPRLLAAGAAGLAATCLVLWAVRGLPLGALAFWAAPLPLLLAGMGFGRLAAGLAVAVAVVALWLSASPVAVGLFLFGFGLPVAALIAAARAGGLGLPLALLGLLPAAGIALAAFWLSGMPGGLEGTLRALAHTGLRRLDLPASSTLVSDIVRVKAAAIGFWVSLALLANGWLAGRLLARLGLGPAPAWSAARLPGWYALAPALAFGIWLAAEDGADAVPLSILLVLLLPLMLHGLAVLHTRTRGLGERPLLLGAVYVALVILFLPASIAVAGYGAFDLLRPSSSAGGGGRGAAPPRS